MSIFPSQRHDANLRAAADWQARRDGGINHREEAEFAAWLEADSRRGDAVRDVAAAWSLLLEPRASGRAAELALALAARRRRRYYRNVRYVTLGTLAAAAMLVLAVRYVHYPTSVVASEESRATAAPERRVLPDGSVVEIKPGSEISVTISAAERKVRLVRGEAHFTVAKDATRPFFVTAGSVEVRAVGTAFSVNLAIREIDVLVTEGIVRVERTGNPTAASQVYRPTDSLLVAAGNEVILPTAGTLPPLKRPMAPADAARALAWRGHWLEFNATPVERAVRLFNRENEIQITVDDPRIAMQQLTGVFWANDPRGFCRLVESTLGVRAIAIDARRIELVP